jgi:multiple sugar transport system permease protein
MTASTTQALDVTVGRPTTAVRPQQRRPLRPTRIALHAFLVVTSLVWLVPLVWTIYVSLRPYSDTAEHGYFSIAHKLSFTNYTSAWTNADLPKYFWNTVIITAPALFFTLLLSSFLAFVVSRFSWWFNLSLLMLFTAGNLLPAQVIITPLFRLYREIPLPTWMAESGQLYNSYWGIIVIHVAFQMGFCTFVLSNYMKTVPHELTEAALVDGASVWRQFWQIIMPLTRPALGALATLQVIWVYNDFFWAVVLMPSGEKRPITSALANLKGVFFTDNNLIAAGTLMAAFPTLIVYLILQRQFINGLTLGSTKN